MTSAEIRGGGARAARRPGSWAPGRATIVVAAVLAVVAGVIHARSAQAPDRATIWHRYPEVARVSPHATYELRRIRGWGHGHEPPLRESAPEHSARVEATLDALGGGAPAALVRYLLERSEALPRNESRFGDPVFDGLESPAAVALGKRSTPETDRVLLRLVADRGIHVEMRVAGAVALCRAGNRAALEPIVDRILDPEESHELRRELLLRLPRFEAPLPERLRELLSVPWFRIDYEAAAVLATSGDAEAPSLVAKALREVRTASSRSRIAGAWLGRPSFVGFLCEGAVRVSRSDPDVAAAAEVVRATIRRVAARGSYTREDSNETAIRDVSDAFAAWLDAHPEAFDTAFERGRAAYRASDRRARELATTSVDAILALDDEEWDLAAGLLLLEERASYDGGPLDALDRLALLLRPGIDAAPTPRAKLDVLIGRLLPRHVTFPSGADPSALTIALRHRAGNCLGSAALFLALGDRLGLPLHAVALPDHVFVRWDDGTTRINLEPTARGVEIADADYATRPGMTRQLEASGSYLRNLSRRQFLAMAHSNRADRSLKARRPAEAVPLCNDALRLDPSCPWALVNRAAALARLVPPPPGSEVFAAVTDAERTGAMAASHALHLLDSLVVAGLPDEALTLAERRRALGDGGDAFDLAVAEAMVAAGRPEDARATIDPLVRAAPRAVDLAAIEVDAARASDPAAWRGVFAAAAERTGNAEELRLTVAERWIRGARTDPEACLAAATALLDEVADLDTSLAWARRVVRGTSRDDRLPIHSRNAARFLGLRAAALERSGGGERAEELRQLESRVRGFGFVFAEETVLDPAPTAK